MRRRIAMLLMTALLLTAAGCTGGETEPTVKETLPKETETTAPSQPQDPEETTGVPEISPMALVGTWERVQTEMEGYIEETPAGQVTLEITGSGQGDLRIAYGDKEFPDQSYRDKALRIIPDGDTMGFGDVAWIAEVDHTGVFGQSFALAIVEDTLVLRSYFMVDGAPGVSYETFRRID